MPLQIIPSLSRALQGPLPGEEAHQRMTSYRRPSSQQIHVNEYRELREGAVLVLLYPKGKALHTVMMRRPKYEGVHSDQVSFPGGKREEQDQHLHHTALREAQEEVGIRPENVELIGQLTQVFIPPSRFMVTPFVGYSTHAPQLSPDPKEVASVIETPVEIFLQEETLMQKRVKVNSMGTHLKVPCFHIQGHAIWGATAMMLSELKMIMEEVKP